MLRLRNRINRSATKTNAPLSDIKPDPKYGKRNQWFSHGIILFALLYIANDYRRHARLEDNDETHKISNETRLTTQVVTLPFSIEGSKHLKDQIYSPVEQISITDFNNILKGQSNRPLLVKKNEQVSEKEQTVDALSIALQQEAFDATFGNYTQYVKNEFVQPLTYNGDKCTAPTSYMQNLMKTSKKNLLFFTNDEESPYFMDRLMKMYEHPGRLNYPNKKNSFSVFSSMVKGSYHGFHKHLEGHIQLLHGSKVWWFLPPDTTNPPKDNPCGFLDGSSSLPNDGKHVQMVLQQKGDTIFVPEWWWHATCALDDWTVSVGMQKGSPHQFEQKFDILPQPYVRDRLFTKQNNEKDKDFIKKHPMPWNDIFLFYQQMSNCGIEFNPNQLDSWQWFNGDLNKYYNTLIQSDSKRNPNEIKTYAVHRWMGKERSTLIHYELILDTIQQFQSERDLHILDAGCGLGAGLMWFETYGPKSMQLTGHTISSEQLNFINNLPSHKFKAELKSYDDLDEYTNNLDVIYSIEAFIHSPDETNTLKQWSKSLKDNGIIIIIDDFLNVGIDKHAEDVQLFSKSWMGNVLQSTSSLADIAEKFGLEVVMDRDLGSEYQIIKRNYRNRLPDISATKAKYHQGWLGSGMRQRLMVEGKLTYRLIVFQKRGASLKEQPKLEVCSSVPKLTPDEDPLILDLITPTHKSGADKSGGSTQECISGWYCCGMGEEWWMNLEENRTHNTGYLKLSKLLFGNYMDKITEHLNQFYSKLPKNAQGKFLDIGGTGSVSSGMRKVTSKFAHFSGPFDYWVLDSDDAAKTSENALHCDMSDCKIANDCDFDVTFSHTVLEHTPYPWKAFDEIARMTKQGGLTMHVVPFSYQYHATPDDHYRFSHKALTSLLEDRGFSILEVGYDICTKPEKVLKENIDEHYDAIWLSYVIGIKN